jgi:hypothetical protein
MWKIHLKHSFGIVDKRFAGHPMDQEKAREARKIAKRDGVTSTEIENETMRILQATPPEHVREQLVKVRKYFKL